MSTSKLQYNKNKLYDSVCAKLLSMFYLRSNVKFICGSTLKFDKSLEKNIFKDFFMYLRQNVSRNNKLYWHLLVCVCNTFTKTKAEVHIDVTYLKT